MESKKRLPLWIRICIWIACVIVFVYSICGVVFRILDWWTGTSLVDPNSPVSQFRTAIIDFISWSLHNWWVYLVLIVFYVFFEHIIRGNNQHQGPIYH